MNADHDDRVVAVHSFKFAATLQECNLGFNPTLIRIESKAGYGGGMPLAKLLQEYSDILSFIMYKLGVKYIEIKLLYPLFSIHLWQFDRI